MDWDRYTYVRNNPVNYNDPTGHATQIPPITYEISNIYIPIYGLWNLVVGAACSILCGVLPVHYENINMANGVIVGDSPAEIMDQGLSLLGVGVMGGSSLTYSALGQATTVTTSGKHISQSGSDISTKTFCRYCSTAELEAIEDTHLLRGGRSGRTYFTTDDYSTILEAQERLALPISPEVKVEFNITNSPNISGPGSVDPDFGQPGGGIQYWSDDPIRVIIKSVLKLE